MLCTRPFQPIRGVQFVLSSINARILLATSVCRLFKICGVIDMPKSTRSGSPDLVSPLPEVNFMLQSTVTSMSSLPSVQHTRLRPKKKPVTDQEQLASIAKSDIALAVETPTLLHIAGAYSLNVSDTAKVYMPPRQSFLSGEKSSVMAQKRWRRGQNRAKAMAMTKRNQRHEASQVARLIGLSGGEFQRNTKELVSFLGELRASKSKASAKGKGMLGNAEGEEHDYSDHEDLSSLGDDGVSHDSGGGGSVDSSSVHKAGGAAMKAKTSLKRQKQLKQRAQVYTEFMGKVLNVPPPSSSSRQQLQREGQGNGQATPSNVGGLKQQREQQEHRHSLGLPPLNEVDDDDDEESDSFTHNENGGVDKSIEGGNASRKGLKLPHHAKTKNKQGAFEEGEDEDPLPSSRELLKRAGYRFSQFGLGSGKEGKNGGVAAAAAAAAAAGGGAVNDGGVLEEGSGSTEKVSGNDALDELSSLLFQQFAEFSGSGGGGRQGSQSAPTSPSTRPSSRPQSKSAAASAVVSDVRAVVRAAQKATEAALAALAANEEEAETAPQVGGGFAGGATAAAALTGGTGTSQTAKNKGAVGHHHHSWALTQQGFASDDRGSGDNDDSQSVSTRGDSDPLASVFKDYGNRGRGSGGEGEGVGGEGEGATDHRVLVEEMQRLVHHGDGDSNGFVAGNGFVAAKRSGGDGSSFGNLALGAAARGREGPTSPTIPPTTTAAAAAASAPPLLSRPLLRSASSVREALARRGLTVQLVFESEYLTRWQRSHSDMFLKVDPSGAPAVVAGSDAEAVLVQACLMDELEAAELVLRSAVLRKRREKAVMRVGSVAWIGNNEPLPASMVVPEYLRREEAEEGSIARHASSLLVSEKDAAGASGSQGVGDSEEGGGGTPTLWSRKSERKDNSEDADGAIGNDPGGASVGALTPSAERPPPSKQSSNRLEREAETARQQVFELKRYPSLAREALRR